MNNSTIGGIYSNFDNGIRAILSVLHIVYLIELVRNREEISNIKYGTELILLPALFSTLMFGVLIYIAASPSSQNMSPDIFIGLQTLLLLTSMGYYLHEKSSKIPILYLGILTIYYSSISKHRDAFKIIFKN